MLEPAGRVGWVRLGKGRAGRLPSEKRGMRVVKEGAARGLVALLARMTAYKCGDRIERFRAARRDVRLEVSAPAADDSNPSWEFLTREPTPVQAVVLTEIIEELHFSLGERDCAILALHLQGVDVAAISTDLQCSERTVFRVLERIRQQLERRCEEA